MAILVNLAGKLGRAACQKHRKSGNGQNEPKPEKSITEKNKEKE